MNSSFYRVVRSPESGVNWMAHGAACFVTRLQVHAAVVPADNTDPVWDEIWKEMRA